ncbi:hypothetical protein L7F22_030720 [Adiantum nelumboides]|nr:hypothetical protein [Adiantum nelumboides]
MDIPSRVGVEYVKKLLTPDARSIHLLAFGTALGSQVWVSFVGGPVQYANLPRQTFGVIQSKIFPYFFGLNGALSLLLVGTLAREFKVIREHPFDIFDSTVYQAFTLATCAVSHIVNGLVIGPPAPRSCSTVTARSVRKARTARTSQLPKMKTLNKEFASLHGISTSLNFVAMGGLIFHALVRRSFPGSCFSWMHPRLVAEVSCPCCCCCCYWDHDEHVEKGHPPVMTFPGSCHQHPSALSPLSFFFLVGSESRWRRSGQKGLLCGWPQTTETVRLGGRNAARLFFFVLSGRTYSDFFVGTSVRELDTRLYKIVARQGRTAMEQPQEGSLMRSESSVGLSSQECSRDDGWKGGNESDVALE